jgi:hypothetical protein
MEYKNLLNENCIVPVKYRVNKQMESRGEDPSISISPLQRGDVRQENCCKGDNNATVLDRIRRSDEFDFDWNPSRPQV